MNFTVLFKNAGVPATGLSPTITIIASESGAVLINSAAMTELAGGFYHYDYSSYIESVPCVAVCDGGAGLANADRYIEAKATIEDLVVKALCSLVGTRNIAFTTLVTGTGTAIPGVKIYVYPDGGSTLIRYGETDANGELVLGLDDGDYTVRAAKTGYTFEDQSLSVSQDASVDVYGSAMVLTAPVPAASCRVYEYCYSQDGATPLAGVIGKAKLVTLPFDADDHLISGSEISGTYDQGSGLLYWDIVQGASVQFKIDAVGILVTKTVPAQASARLYDLA